MYDLLDAAGATLCDPLLIILLAVMMMPSGGSSYVFSGKTDDVGFLLLKARCPCALLTSPPLLNWQAPPPPPVCPAAKLLLRPRCNARPRQLGAWCASR